jgi:release factor glutamine methyltransferase
VTKDTLTPRPDTETLIEALLDQVAEPPARVLDLGTGTGCIVLALLSEWSDAVGVGIDASAEALKVAKENAVSLDLKRRVRFSRADWTQAHWALTLIQKFGGPFDVVVSNPPYIPEDDIAGLDEDVRAFEPLRALDGGADGLDAYRIIVESVRVLLVPGGLVAFEVGAGQADAVAKLLTDAGLNLLERRKDLAGIERVVVARWEP